MDEEPRDRVEDDQTEHLGELEDQLMRSVDDGRLDSGATGPDSDNVLDFIQMTGLTAPRARPDHSSGPGSPEEPPSEEPLSFYESGVSDVDVAMDPSAPAIPGLDAVAVPDTEAPGGDSGSSVSGLKEIIAELTGGDLMDETSSSPVIGGPPKGASTPGSNAQRPIGNAPSTQGAAGNDEAPVPYTSAAVDPQSSESDPAQHTNNPASSGDDAPNSTPESGESTTAGLDEARGLIDELDDKISDLEAVAATESSEVSPRSFDFDAVPEAAANSIDYDATLEDDGDVGSPDYFRRIQARRRRRLFRTVRRVTTFFLLAGVVVAGVNLTLSRTESSESLYASANQLLEQGMYAQASKEFITFTRRFPTNVTRSDAMFMAGYALQLTPPSSRDGAQRAYTESIVLLERFVSENPSHVKVARAETMIGVLYFKTNRHLDAVNILGDPDRRLRDPGAYLTTLRTLGRAYAALSQVENAHSAFMRSASLEENMAPDADYVELGTLYQALAKQSSDPATKRAYLENAVEQWDFALRVPGLLKSRRDDIRLLRDVVSGRLESGKLERSTADPARQTEVIVRGKTREGDSGNDASSESLETGVTSG